MVLQKIKYVYYPTSIASIDPCYPEILFNNGIKISAISARCFKIAEIAFELSLKSNIFTLTSFQFSRAFCGLVE